MGSAVSVARAGNTTAPKRNNAVRLFGCDLFICFALGPPPRGTHRYVSDLARRLRELCWVLSGRLRAEHSTNYVM